jgi:hypothetical protein
VVGAVVFGVLAVLFATRDTTFSTVMAVFAAAVALGWLYLAVAPPRNRQRRERGPRSRS